MEGMALILVSPLYKLQGLSLHLTLFFASVLSPLLFPISIAPVTILASESLLLQIADVLLP